MNNARDAYLERSRRVTSLLVWIQAEVDCHERQAMKPENADSLRPMVDELEVIEKELKPALWFLSKMTDVEIEEALNDGGQGND